LFHANRTHGVRVSFFVHVLHTQVIYFFQNNLSLFDPKELAKFFFFFLSSKISTNFAKIWEIKKKLMSQNLKKKKKNLDLGWPLLVVMQKHAFKFLLLPTK
jgi:hypothetical protein